MSKKATTHFAINIDLYNDLSEERSAAHQLKYSILKMKSHSNREYSDFKDAQNVDENKTKFSPGSFMLTLPLQGFKKVKNN